MATPFAAADQLPSGQAAKHRERYCSFMPRISSDNIRDVFEGVDHRRFSRRLTAPKHPTASWQPGDALLGKASPLHGFK
jgi:hypothetical protein